MKAAVALLLVAVERGVALTTRGAAEGGVRVDAGPDASDEEYGPEDIELQEWLGPEGLTTAEEEVAAAHAALSTSLQAMGTLLGARQSGAHPMPISEICGTIGLSTQACERVGAYLGRLANVSERVSLRVPKFATRIGCDRLLATSLLGLCKLDADGSAQVYRKDVCAAFVSAPALLSNGNALFKFGDRKGQNMCFPTFVKTRLVSQRDDNYALLDLNHARHWSPMAKVAQADSQWAEKKAKLVWRGVSTGTCDTKAINSRMMLCDKWFNSSDPRIDVAMTEVVQGCYGASKYRKGAASMEQLLKFKYHLVVNGNDKASGLNWVLLSNSVPVMVEPDIESWLLESSLKAWEHYIPIKPDFSDLGEKVNWAVENDVEVERIAKAGAEYVQQFGTLTQEMAVEAAVLAAYLDRMHVTDGAGAEAPKLETRAELQC